MGDATKLGMFTRAESVHVVADRLLTLARSKLSGHQVKISISHVISPSPVTANFHGTFEEWPADAKQKLDALPDGDVALVTGASLELLQPFNGTLKYATTDGITAQLRLEGFHDDRLACAIGAAAADVFEVGSYTNVYRAANTQGVDAAMAMRERSVEDLKTAVKDLGAYVVQMAREAAADQRKHQEEYERRTTEARNAYEQRDAERRAEIAAQVARLAADREQMEMEFKARSDALDVRNPKAVRRDLTKQLIATMTEMEAVGLSKDTSKKRRPIHAFVWTLLTAAAVLCWVMASRLSSSQSVDWQLLLPLSAGFLAFVGTTVYYLKWNDRWFREHADVEFSAKQYKADVLRAAWAAELVHEWANESKGDLPDELLAACTTGLFKHGAPSRVNEHPIDQLVALVKDVNAIEVGKGVVSVRSDRGGQATSSTK